MTVEKRLENALSISENIKDGKICPNNLYDLQLHLSYALEQVKKLTIPVVVHSKNKPKRVSGDFDVWYKPCTRCGYDTGKSTKPKDGNKTCWKCGNFVQRDYTDRALK